MSRFKACDDCGGYITKVGKDGFRVKSGHEFGDSCKVVGMQKRGNGIIKESHTVVTLCIECMKYHNMFVDTSCQTPQFFDADIGKEEDTPLQKLMKKKALKSKARTFGGELM